MAAATPLADERLQRLLPLWMRGGCWRTGNCSGQEAPANSNGKGSEDNNNKGDKESEGNDGKGDKGDDRNFPE